MLLVMSVFFFGLVIVTRYRIIVFMTGNFGSVGDIVSVINFEWSFVVVLIVLVVVFV